MHLAPTSDPMGRWGANQEDKGRGKMREHILVKCFAHGTTREVGDLCPDCAEEDAMREMGDERDPEDVP